MRPTLLVLAGLLSAGNLPAQQLRTLARPEAEFEEPFTSINGVRELSDGRVVVIDVRDKLVQLVDFRTGAAKKIGREGSGPREYALPMAVVALPGDTSGVYDPLNQRMLLITPTGEPGDFIRITPEVTATAGGRGFGITLTPPRYTDAQGRFYYVGGGFRPGAGGETPDSQPILRFTRGARANDTVAWIRVPKNNVRSSGSGQQRTVMVGMANPFAARDEWVVTPDGRVAVIRSPEYRVDWTGSSRSTGTPIAYEKVRLTEKHKTQWRENQRSSGTRLTMRVGPGGATSAAAGGGDVRIPEPTDWPDVLPPFTSNAAFVTPTGQIWISRTREANDNTPKYDIIDATGKVVSRVAFPAKTRVVGFGKGVVYTVRNDEDDLQYLQRFRLP